MDVALLDILRCPTCAGAFTAEAIDSVGADLRDGFLVCECDRYPVVAGIPVLRKDVPRQLAEVRAELDGGRPDRAFLCLAQPPLPPVCDAAARRPALRRTLRALHRIRRGRWSHARLAAATGDGRGGHASLMELLDLYFAGAPENGNYFRYRWTQPRHLVALAMCTLFERRSGRVLDLGCGCGHLFFALEQAGRSLTPVGLDTFYFGLWLARHRLATAAEVVCARADGPLPFRDGCFAGVLCTDSFHYFESKAIALRELLRLVDRGPLVLTGMHNARVPRTLQFGSPLTPESYARLAADVPHRLLADDETLDRYVFGSGPELARCSSPEALATSSLLSMVLSRSADTFHCSTALAPPPLHARGVPKLNPLFTARYESAGVTAVRTLPSPAFAADHPQLCRYLPASAPLGREVTAALEARRWTDVLYRLAERYVVLGLPA